MYKFLLISVISLSNALFAEGSTLENCFTELTQQRHSGYAFNAEKPVSKEAMVKMATAASLAPSSYNDQPWRFIFCDKTTDPEAHAKALSCLVEANQKWAGQAPLLIIVVANTISSYNQKFNTLAEYDTGAAAITLCYEATTLGLMAHQMGGIEAKKITEAFGLGDNLKPLTAIAVGYEPDNAGLTPKKRKPLGEMFFMSKPGNALK